MDEKQIELAVEALMARLQQEIEVKLKEPEPDKSNLSKLQADYHSIAHLYQRIKIDPASVRISDVPEEHRHVFKLSIKGVYKDGKFEQSAEAMKELGLRETTPKVIKIKIESKDAPQKNEAMPEVISGASEPPTKLLLLAVVVLAVALVYVLMRHH